MKLRANTDPAVMSVRAMSPELEGLKIEHQAALVRTVSEGEFHTGEASVVQVPARKA